MFAWLLWCLSVLAMSCLMSSMSKHQRDIFTNKVNDKTTQILQMIGWGLLILTAIISIVYKGASIGLSEWLGCLTFAALFVGLVVTYYPKRLVQINSIVAVLFFILSLFILI